MKISVIIPTCNRPEFLKEALDSVLKQTVKPHEIIVVDNGEKDIQLSPEFCAVKVSTMIPYAGAAQARNFGASLSSGDYLAFLDDDDLWPPEYLQKVEYAFKQGAGCVISRIDKLEDGSVSPCQNPHGKIIMEHLLVYNPGINGSNIAISKEAFYKVGGFDPKLPPSEDKSLLLEVLKSGMPIQTLPDNHIIFRFHQAQRLTDAEKMAEGIYQFMRKYRKLMNIRQRLQNWQKIYRYRYESGERLSFFPFIFLYVILQALRRIGL